MYNTAKYITFLKKIHKLVKHVRLEQLLFFCTQFKVRDP